MKFIEAVKDKPYSYHAFQILYWCGLRVGELLALTPQDIDFDNKVIRITKSYQRLEGKDVITDPKTPKSKRNVSMPDFLCEELKDYIGRLYGILPTDRIFHLTKSFLHHEMTRGAEKAQKQADKYQKRMNELAPMVKNMEKLAADFSTDPEQTLPEAAVMESAKSYREKKAKPLVKKIVQVMRSVYSAYLDISNKVTKLQAAYNRERSGNERLTNRLEEVLAENRELRIVAADFERIKAVIGSEQVNACY